MYTIIHNAKKISLYIFFFLFTAFMFLYAGMVVVFDKYELYSIFDQIPGMIFIGSFLGSIENSTKYNKKVDIGKKIQGFMYRKQNNLTQNTGESFIINNQHISQTLYTPLFYRTGEVNNDIRSLKLQYHHPGKDISKTKKINIQKDTLTNINTREQKVSITNEMMFYGKNVYTFEIEYNNNTVQYKTFTIYIQYDQIRLGNTTVYLDKNFHFSDGQPIIHNIIDEGGTQFSLISQYCTVQGKNKHILIKQDGQYREIPTCAIFSQQESSSGSLIRFVLQSFDDTSYYFDIRDHNQGILVYKYNLINKKRGSRNPTIVFYNKKRKILTFIETQGDLLYPVVKKTYYSVTEQKQIAQIIHTNLNQLLVTNQKEKILIYLYKERSDYNALPYPGLRYHFFTNDKRINQGTLSLIDFLLLGTSKKDRSTFSFSIQTNDMILTLDDGYHIVTFDILDIGRSISVHKKDITKTQCKNAHIEIYKNLKGDIAKKEYKVGNPDTTFFLVGEGFFAPTIKIFHNMSQIPQIQNNNGRFHVQLNKMHNTLHAGKNVYTIVGYDENDNVMCFFQKELTVP